MNDTSKEELESGAARSFYLSYDSADLLVKSESGNFWHPDYNHSGRVSFLQEFESHSLRPLNDLVGIDLSTPPGRQELVDAIGVPFHLVIWTQGFEHGLGDVPLQIFEDDFYPNKQATST